MIWAVMWLEQVRDVPIDGKRDNVAVLVLQVRLLTLAATPEEIILVLEAETSKAQHSRDVIQDLSGRHQS